VWDQTIWHLTVHPETPLEIDTQIKEPAVSLP
jgi:hypothetical protein